MLDYDKARITDPAWPPSGGPFAAGVTVERPVYSRAALVAALRDLDGYEQELGELVAAALWGEMIVSADVPAGEAWLVAGGKRLGKIRNIGE